METYSDIQGLTVAEVEQKQALGLANTSFDNYSTTYTRIVVRNIFNIINIVVFPLMIILAVFQLYVQVFSFSTFLIINTLVSIIDEVRVKRQIDKLKVQFQQTTQVIRDGKKQTIPVSQVVQGDFVYGQEGEGIIADGEIQAGNYLQVDESVLTGESNYIEKQAGEKLLAGSFIVTGNCVYVVKEVGRNNYLNQLGQETLRFKTAKSSLQRDGDRVIAFLVALAIVLAVFNFVVTNNHGLLLTDRLLSITAIVSLIIPQTLVFLFTLSFTISIVKLYRKGVLVRKGGSIQELADIDVICFDKTGTITTNDMKIVEVKEFNLDVNLVGSIYSAVKPQIVGVTKTQLLLHDYFGKYKPVTVTDFNQVPFTSKQKYSLVYGRHGEKNFKLAFGAASVLLPLIDAKQRTKVSDFVATQEQAGNRVLLGVFADDVTDSKWNDLPQATQAIVFAIEETLNPGINRLLEGLTSQGIQVKIISGDSLTAVGRVAQKINVPGDQITDLSVDRDKLAQLVTTKTIFTRANPEDKVTIIKALRDQGHRVAMIGDGINDVLAMKAADVSIAMESSAKITHDTADIVLLGNDYTKVPMIFYEGDNIIHNLKISTKIFLVKTTMAALVAGFFTFLSQNLPLNPTSVLIFSFLGSSVPSYVLVFSRQRVNSSTSFFKDVTASAFINGVIFAILTIVLYYILKAGGYTGIQISTSLVMLLLVLSIMHSLYLLWETNKLRNIFYAAAIFIIIVTIGTFETILPIYNYAQAQQIEILAAIAIGLSFIAVVAYPFMRKWALKRRLLAYVGALIVVSLALFFPFQDYYSVTNIPESAVVSIVELALVGFGLIVVSNWLRRKLLRF